MGSVVEDVNVVESKLKGWGGLCPSNSEKNEKRLRKREIKPHV